MLGRSAVVVGFAAMSWGALTGVAFAVESASADQPAAPASSVAAPNAAVEPTSGTPAGSPNGNAGLAPVTHALSAVGHVPVVDALPISIPGSIPASTPGAPATTAQPPDSHRVSAAVGGLVAGVGTVTKDVTKDVTEAAGAAIGQPALDDARRTAQTSTSSSPAARADSAADAAAASSPQSGPLLEAVGTAVHDTVQHTVGGVVHDTLQPTVTHVVHDTLQPTVTGVVRDGAGLVGQASTTVRTTTSALASTLVVSPGSSQGSVLGGVLDSLGLDRVLPVDALAAIPLPQIPLLNEQAGPLRQILPSPAGTTDQASGSGLSGASDTPGTGPGATAPITPVAVPGVSPHLVQTVTGGDGVAPIAISPYALLGGQVLPTLFGGELGQAGGQGATLAEHTDGVRDSALASLRNGTQGGDHDGVLPIPTDPSAPGGHGGGATGGAASDRGVDGFQISDTRPGDAAQVESWGLPVSPTFDPGFSPD